MIVIVGLSLPLDLLLLKLGTLELKLVLLKQSNFVWSVSLTEFGWLLVVDFTAHPAYEQTLPC